MPDPDDMVLVRRDDLRATGLEAHAMGCAASKVTVPYRPEDVVLVESDDRPGDWRGVYVPVAASGDAP